MLHVQATELNPHSYAICATELNQSYATGTTLWSCSAKVALLIVVLLALRFLSAVRRARLPMMAPSAAVLSFSPSAPSSS